MGYLTDTTINYYEILDVSPQATSQEIYQSYLRVKRAYSLRNPELFRNFSIDEIQQLLLYIEEAYATLGNPQSRDLYNAHFFKLQPKISADMVEDDDISAPSASASGSVGHHAPVVSPPSSSAMGAGARSGLSEDSTLSLQTETAVIEKPLPTALKSGPPQGYASTSTSIYEVDTTFETLIEAQEFFDGIFLSKVRKYKKVKLEDFSQQTCISIRYLYAIENNNYNALPAPVFVRGYINQYCKMLNLDADKVITSFMKLYHNGRE